MSGGGVGGCCMLRRGEITDVPERRVEALATGGTILRLNVNRRSSFSVTSEDCLFCLLIELCLC